MTRYNAIFLHPRIARRVERQRRRAMLRSAILPQPRESGRRTCSDNASLDPGCVGLLGRQRLPRDAKKCTCKRWYGNQRHSAMLDFPVNVTLRSSFATVPNMKLSRQHRPIRLGDVRQPRPQISSATGDRRNVILPSDAYRSVSLLPPPPRRRCAWRFRVYAGK